MAMNNSFKIMRLSIHTFLNNYHSVAATASLLVFPVSAAILLSQAITPSFLSTNIISSRLRSLFEAAGFPASSFFFSFLQLKLSQTAVSYVFTLPFSLTFLVLAKVSIVRTIHEYTMHGRACPPKFSSFMQLYSPVLQTFLFNSFAILTANVAVFSLVFVAFNLIDIAGLSSGGSLLALSAAGAILYSTVIASTVVTCNLGIIVSAVENSGGYLPVIKACMLVRGRTATALSLALSANLGMAGVEALFQSRVIRPYHLSAKFNPSLIWESFSIAYIYSLLIVLDVIMSYMFIKSCHLGYRSDSEKRFDYLIEFEPEGKAALQA